MFILTKTKLFKHMHSQEVTLQNKEASAFQQSNWDPLQHSTQLLSQGEAFHLLLQIRTDTELVLYLPEQWICCKPKLLLSGNFKETRKHFDHSEINTCSGICGLIKQNSLLTVFIHLIFSVTLTLQLKVLVNKS